ncbi:MAG: hypothetical protein QNJ40_07850 [Xanthomonadales bacterium]|nr:hypothetical protein [Xanthomonadales bacterium]
MNKPPNWLRLTLSILLTAGFTMALADDDDDDSDEIPFDEANVYFELNNTDGDLGIHALIDGEPWKKLEIEGPNERTQLLIRLRSKLRRQGLTELFFESAEPTFDELDPADFFARFPEGDYEVSGDTIEGDELESTAEVTHLLPAPPVISVNATELPDGCDGAVPEISTPFTVSWEEVELSHPELGRTNEPLEVEIYQLVLERLSEPELNFTVDVESDITSVAIPSALVGSGDEFKVEVLVREESGNQTATESCFNVR